MGVQVRGEVQDAPRSEANPETGKSVSFGARSFFVPR